jgi:hypothetical protein
MGGIYGKADRVIVWLGEANKESDAALEEIRVAASKNSTTASTDENSTTPSIDKPVRSGILTLLERNWFKRIWVMTRLLETLKSLLTAI